jgi:hypothetical protein
MVKLPEFLPTSPITVICPRCKAKPGQACDKLNNGFDVVHVERIAVAAAKDLKAKEARER